MSIFMLDTDSVSSAASTIETIASQITSISSSVSGYDTSCEDFDFSSAKSVIAGNIEACATKVSNTANAMNSVVSSHTALQNGLKFGAEAEQQQNNNSSYQPVSSGGYSGGYSGGTSGGGGYSGGSYYPSGVTPSPGGNNETNTETTPPVSEQNPVEVNTKVDGIGHSPVAVDDLSEVGKSLFENDALVYNAAGYATIGGMFIIACGSVYGKVGDIVEFTLSDGQKFKCIIGKVTDSKDGKIEFFVNDQWKEDGEENFQSEIGDYVTKIENQGQAYEYTQGATITSALDWAKEVADDNSHGYSQSSRWGNPNYDCSSFVISAYEAAGIAVKEAGASYTGNMKEAFLKCGFEWIPGTPDVNNLQPGDVLLDIDEHTEMYYGNGLMIGAHSDGDGRNGDSSGNEINLSKYSNKNWDGVLRYVGPNKSSSKKVDPPTAPRVNITSGSTPVTTPTSTPETNPETTPNTTPETTPETLPTETTEEEPNIIEEEETVDDTDNVVTEEVLPSEDVDDRTLREV